MLPPSEHTEGPTPPLDPEAYKNALMHDVLVEAEAWQQEHRHADLIHAWVSLLSSLAYTCNIRRDGSFFSHEVCRLLTVTALIQVFGAGKTTLGEGMCKALGVTAVREGLLCEHELVDDPRRNAMLQRILALTCEDTQPVGGDDKSFQRMQYICVDYRYGYEGTTEMVQGRLQSVISKGQGLVVHLDEVGALTPGQVATMRQECAKMMCYAIDADTLVFFLWTGRSLDEPMSEYQRVSLSQQFDFIDVKPLTTEQIQRLTLQLLHANPLQDKSRTSVSGRTICAVLYSSLQAHLFAYLLHYVRTRSRSQTWMCLLTSR